MTSFWLLCFTLKSNRTKWSFLVPGTRYLWHLTSWNWQAFLLKWNFIITSCYLRGCSYIDHKIKEPAQKGTVLQILYVSCMLKFLIFVKSPCWHNHWTNLSFYYVYRKNYDLLVSKTGVVIWVHLHLSVPMHGYVSLTLSLSLSLSLSLCLFVYVWLFFKKSASISYSKDLLQIGKDVRDFCLQFYHKCFLPLPWYENIHIYLY